VTASAAAASYHLQLQLQLTAEVLAIRLAPFDTRGKLTTTLITSAAAATTAAIATANKQHQRTGEHT
jgi:hypothetical protein